MAWSLLHTLLKVQTITRVLSIKIKILLCSTLRVPRMLVTLTFIKQVCVGVCVCVCVCVYVCVYWAWPNLVQADLFYKVCIQSLSYLLIRDGQH